MNNSLNLNRLCSGGQLRFGIAKAKMLLSCGAWGTQLNFSQASFIYFFGNLTTSIFIYVFFACKECN